MFDPVPFDPEAILETLEEHDVRFILIGGLAATLYGSPHVTTDVDVTPKRDPANLAALSAALIAMKARVRTEGEPDGVAFDPAPALLAQMMMILNLTTRFGDLDLTFEPSGTQGYEDLKRNAVEIDIRGTRVVVAALADVIRSKEAAGRDKDRLVLPTLRRLLDRLDAE